MHPLHIFFTKQNANNYTYKQNVFPNKYKNVPIFLFIGVNFVSSACFLLHRTLQSNRIELWINISYSQPHFRTASKLLEYALQQNLIKFCKIASATTHPSYCYCYELEGYIRHTRTTITIIFEIEKQNCASSNVIKIEKKNNFHSFMSECFIMLYR